MNHDLEDENVAATLAREMKGPIEILSNMPASVRRIALPPDWRLQEIDEEALLEAPRRKKALVTLHDAPSFIQYVKRHGSLSHCTVWCNADYARGKIGFTAIINDNGEKPEEPDWRDHRAVFFPTFSEEWDRWTGRNRSQFTQFEFANYIEDNNKDIVSVDGSASGAQMLEMALNMEANKDVKFKSAIRLQNGGVSLNYIADDDAQTTSKMQLFERFSIGVPVFLGDDPYRIDARLRYRVRESKLTFWYELIRPDLVLAAATGTTIEAIQAQVGMPFFFGEP